MIVNSKFDIFNTLSFECEGKTLTGIIVEVVIAEAGYRTYGIWYTVEDEADGTRYDVEEITLTGSRR